MSANVQSPLLSKAEAALILRCSPAHVRDLAARGDLVGLKVAGRWRFRREHIDDYLDRVTSVDPWKRSTASKAQLRRRRSA